MKMSFPNSILRSATVLCMLMFFSINKAYSVADFEFDETYTYSTQGRTWSLTDCSDKGDYWLCPNSGTESVVTIPNIFIEKEITTGVVVTLNVATFGSGDNPTASSFALYSESSCTNSVTAAQSGTLPTSSTYTNVVYTVALANTGSLTQDLAIKITKPGKQIRLNQIRVEFSYKANPASITLNEAGETTDLAGAYYVGRTYTLPSSTEATCGDKEFVGWSSVSVAETNTQPSTNFYTIGGTATLSTSNTFYAVFAESESTTSETSTFNSLSWGVSEGPSWIFEEKGAAYSSGVQVTTGVSGAGATTVKAFVGVTSVEVTYATNASSGAGSIAVTVGGASTTGDKDVTKTGGTEARTITYTPNLPATELHGTVNISVTCTTNSLYIKSVKINYKTYSAYSTTCAARYDITLHDNNGGSNNGSAKVIEDGTALISITPPTKTGYNVEGYYTTSDCTTKIATDEGALQNGSGSGITVSGNVWTNSSSEWKRGADETFYTKWSAKEYSITLDNESATTDGSTSVTLTYNSATHSAITNPVKTGYNFGGWYTGDDGTGTLVINASGVLQANVDDYTGAGGIWTKDAECTLYALWTAKTYTDYVFSCSELTLTPHLVTASTPIFITSAAGKKVRSQDYITITGNGLASGATISFPGLDSKFEVKTSTGGALPAVDANGEINVDAYIFYTPASGSDDHIDKLTGLTASVGGAKPKTVTLEQEIIGRRLPANFVIAGKKDNKWYAMPSNMGSTTNPKPSEIAVNNINNPSIAYTASTNIYGLEGPTTSGVGNNISSGYGQYVRLTMSIDDGTNDPHAAPLFGSATGTRTIGKSGNSQATSDLSAGWWWALEQTNTSITNPQDAKYTIKCANNTSTLSLRDNAGNPDWGLFASGVDELRLIPASSVTYTEAYFVEWGQHGGVIEVDAANAGGSGQAATSVVAHLGEASSSAITLSQTGTSGNGTATKYNYTVNFGNGIDFADPESNGALLLLEWKNGEAVKAMTSIVVPKIIAEDGEMKTLMSGDTQWETEVHVLPDVTLTANAGDFSSNDVKINHLEIYPGATVIVTKGAQDVGTLKVKTLVLRNGWSRTGSKKYDVARLYITPTTASLAKNAADDVWYSEWYIDYDQYYPIAVPWKVTVEDISYKNSNVSPASSGMKLRYFDGAERANPATSVSNWKLFGEGGNRPTPTYLEPGKGYALTAKRPSGKAFAILRMPLTIPSASWTALGEQGRVTVDAVTTYKDTVHVTGWGVGNSNVPWYAIGWNFIANPYMATFKCVLDEEDDDDIEELAGKIAYENGTEVRYVNIPDIDFQNFDQVNVTEATIKPSTGFFIQAKDATEQAITFNSSKIVAPSAPERYLAASADAPDQEAYIRLTGESCRDQMGIIIGSDYTEAYDFNADLAKLLGETNALKTYMHYTDIDMAYLAINEQLAREEIPVVVKIPAAGEYTYSLRNSSTVDQLEGLYLIDYQTGITTNLIFDDYTFTAEAGTFANRFAINAIVGERQVPTEVDISGVDKMQTEPVKFIYHDKVFILHHGVIYDSTGKRVNQINK